MYIKILKFKKGVVVLALVSFLIGCGGSGGGNNDGSDGRDNDGGGGNVPTGTFKVNAVDDNILGAIVSAPECASFSEDGDGEYTLKECVTTPSYVNVINGFVDTINNGVQDDNETAQIALLKLNVSQSGSLNNFIVTPLTTLAAQDTDLSTLAKALGISQDELFEDKPKNRGIQRALNAILISARKAGITKFDSFVHDLATQIKDTNTTGLNALNAVKTYMQNHKESYKTRFGVVFGGFIDDTSALDLTSSTVLSDVESTHTVTKGKIVLGGFIYDTVIPNATVALYNGTNEIAKTSSDENGRYFLQVDKNILDASKVYKLEAISGNIKLISYITTQELKDNLTGRQVSSGNLEDLIVSNVTTAKAVLVQKINSGAENNATAMNESKALVENLYNQDILTISGIIKDVIDNNTTLTTASDTLDLAKNIVEVNSTTKELTTTLPNEVNQTSVDTQVANIQNDPLLSTQVDSTTIVSEGNLRAIMENHILYEFSYDDLYQPTPLIYDTIEVHHDGSFKSYEYFYDENNLGWTISDDNSENAGTMLWSSDGSKLYIGSTDKITLIAKGNITVLGNSVTIYHLQIETIREPEDGYYTDFVANANDNGTINFSSINDDNKEINISNTIYHLDANGTYHQNNQSQQYKYRTMVKDGKTFVVFDDGETDDGDGAMIYLDFANQKAYIADYHNIGFKDRWIEYDSETMSKIWKNLPYMQQNELVTMISDAQANATYSASNTWTQIVERVIYHYIKSLEGKEGLKKFLAEREMYRVTNEDNLPYRIDTLNFAFDLSSMDDSGTDNNGAYHDTIAITDYNATSFTLDGGTLITIQDITDDYILIDLNTGTEHRIERVYYNQTKAEAYMNTLN